ncbi:copper resistance protein CopC [Pelagibius litoralis]|uniref:Copper resistance protein CopC n=1 Tax=Pelagibius litoralis TaxID=374515 RepID=A0A967EVK6_9PROT|nr:copper resistance CopC family protein [Pelagibius litoralis]NIA67969.1 copper resistance protein CopC [Pelagibius litoralis]
MIEQGGAPRRAVELGAGQRMKLLTSLLRALACLAVVFVAVVFMVVAADPVFAHSKGPKVTPADGSELAVAPEVLTFSFPKAVRLTAVRLFDSDDSEITLPGKRDISAASERSIALPALGAGRYRVLWRALSADGHPVDGEFGFTVAPAN